MRRTLVGSVILCVALVATAMAEGFVAGGTFPTGTSPRFVALADFNGDKILDMAVANYGSNSISILQGNGDGTFKPAVNYAVGASPWMVVAGDFNNDGILDLATMAGATNVADILLGNGDGTFQPAYTVTRADESHCAGGGRFECRRQS
jgi:hypothetical protein